VNFVLPLSRRELPRPCSPTAGASSESGSEKMGKALSVCEICGWGRGFYIRLSIGNSV